MGTGIAAVIPITIRPHNNAWPKELRKEDFPRKFFDNYVFNEDGRIYTIKNDVLLSHYKPFLSEFADCIGDNYYDKLYASIPNADTYEEFITVFGKDVRGTYPRLESNLGMFSTLGGVCDEFWLFYYGSSHAFLETYDTLLHFEWILERAIQNPLASAVKFGIYG